MTDEARGFLGRWARRKTDASQGKPLDEPAVVAKPAPVMASGSVVALPEQQSASSVAPISGARPEEQPEKALSLDDVKLLTRDSDFKPFMASKVGPEVRNAAMKKLFADPHFNVMDGLDIYIDDYSKADPIPESMLRQMVGAKFLKLFDDEENAKKQQAPSASPEENANSPDREIVAQSLENPDLADPDPIDPELSSQPAQLPDAAAGPPRPCPQ